MSHPDIIERPELARVTDPHTSQLAADQLTDAALSQQKAAIVALLTEEPRDDLSLTEAYFNLAEERGWPVTDRDSIRKRRAQLRNAGKVVPVGTHIGPHNREVTIWAATS